MGSHFHFQTACNSIIHSTEKELNGDNGIRLSLDVQLPHQVNGDEQGLGFSILHISKFLSQLLDKGKIDIEVYKIGHDTETISVKIDIRGTDKKYKYSKKSPLESLNKLEWMRRMPYKTSFVRHPGYYLFSFEMTFQHEGMDDEQSALIFFEKRILLAEDNEMSAFVFYSFLEEWGCKVTRVASGENALNLFEKNVFDMVLVDSYMPDLNGNQVIKNIRAMDTGVPIIALISSSLEKDVLKWIAVGANDFLLKPINSLHLKIILKKYLG